MTGTVGDSFDPDTLALLRQVLDDAWQGLSPKQQSRILKSDFAQTIVRLARHGERDPVRLRSVAVTEVIGADSQASGDK